MTRHEVAEALRIVTLYRRCVLLARARLPISESLRLVGPDRAFRIYGRLVRTPRRRQASRRARRR